MAVRKCSNFVFICIYLYYVLWGSICIYVHYVFCSGHGVSGTALLVINSFIATAAMFAGGMGMHAAMKKGMI